MLKLHDYYNLGRLSSCNCWNIAMDIIEEMPEDIKQELKEFAGIPENQTMGILQRKITEIINKNMPERD